MKQTLTVTFRDKTPIKDAPIIKETSLGYFIQSPVTVGMCGDTPIEKQNNSAATEWVPRGAGHIVSLQVKDIPEPVQEQLAPN